MNATIAKVVAWSLEQAASGHAPSTGFYGEVLEKGTYRAMMAGKTLAGGYKTLACVARFPQYIVTASPLREINTVFLFPLKKKKSKLRSQGI